MNDMWNENVVSKNHAHESLVQPSAVRLDDDALMRRAHTGKDRRVLHNLFRAEHFVSHFACKHCHLR